MKFGAFFLNQSPEMRPSDEVYGRSIEMAVAADQLGFDSVWLAEHHFSSYGYCPHPLLMAVKIAERTKNVRIGIAVMVIPFFHPLRLAEDIAMADQLMDGRLDLGVGRGYQPFEFERFGVPIEENMERFNEIMDIVTRCLSEDGVSYQGKYFQFPETHTFPRPLQKPHPPFWHAGSTTTSMRLSAERGYHCISSGPLEQLKENSAVYNQALASHGWGPREFTILRHTFLSHDPAEIEKQYDNAMYVRRTAAHLRAGTEKVINGQAFAQPLPDEPSREEFLETTLLMGSPEECLKKIERFRDQADVTYLLCQFDIGGLETDKALASMELFAKEVMPRLRETEKAETPGAVS
ncbi:MAG: LLM class flavin-dependent oxidoreductase [Dehalococcoidia bacterium]